MVASLDVSNVPFSIAIGQKPHLLISEAEGCKRGGGT